MLFFYEYFNELWLPKGIDAKDQILNFKFFHDFNKFMPEEELEFKFKFEIPAKTTWFWVAYKPLSSGSNQLFIIQQHPCFQSNM